MSQIAPSIGAKRSLFAKVSTLAEVGTQLALIPASVVDQVSYGHLLQPIAFFSDRDFVALALIKDSERLSRIDISEVQSCACPPSSS